MPFDLNRKFAHAVMRACLLLSLQMAVPLSAQPADLAVGVEAPDFALRSLQQQNLRLSEFRGDVVLINFWASWCGGCRQAMPALNDIYDKYRRAGLVMLSVNLDDDHHHAESMSKSLKIAYPVLLDQRKEAGKLYRIETMPTTLLIDRAGTIRHVFVGYSLGDEQTYLSSVRELLNE